jgi:hypothetical protein
VTCPLRNGSKPILRESKVDTSIRHYASHNGDKWKSTNAKAPVPLSLERDRVGDKEKVKYAVDEADVDCDEEQDGFHSQHHERLTLIYGQEGLDINLVLIGGCVKSPVSRLEAKLFRSALKEYWTEGFWVYEPEKKSDDDAQYQGDPAGPAEAKVRVLSEKTTYYWIHCWA